MLGCSDHPVLVGKELLNGQAQGRAAAERPDALTSRSFRAGALAALGRPRESEAAEKAVLEIRTRFLGPEHPDYSYQSRRPRRSARLECANPPMIT